LLSADRIDNQVLVERTKTGWPKACGCGETWSRHHWGELTPVGRYRAEEWIELRSCVCGKTLVVLESELVDQTNDSMTPSAPKRP